MKIGDLARRIGCSVSTLRLYERLGLVGAGRSAGGTRRYSAEDVARAEAVASLARADIPLADLEALAAVRGRSASGDTASRDVDALLGTLEARLSERLAVLQAVLRDIRAARERLPACRGCMAVPRRETCAPCPVSPGLLECRVMRLVWDRDEEAPHDSGLP